MFLLSLTFHYNLATV